jgi:hypothetical protein
MQDTQFLKTKIISALDLLPLESLKLLAEFVDFLRAKAQQLTTSRADTKPLINPLAQLGLNPVSEEVTDASINHDKYLYL